MSWSGVVGTLAGLRALFWERNSFACGTIFFYMQQSQPRACTWRFNIWFSVFMPSSSSVSLATYARARAAGVIRDRCYWLLCEDEGNG